jgi:hypothetical protein
MVAINILVGLSVEVTGGLKCGMHGGYEIYMYVALRLDGINLNGGSFYEVGGG